MSVSPASPWSRRSSPLSTVTRTGPQAIHNIAQSVTARANSGQTPRKTDSRSIGPCSSDLSSYSNQSRQICFGFVDDCAPSQNLPIAAACSRPRPHATQHCRRECRGRVRVILSAAYPASDGDFALAVHGKRRIGECVVLVPNLGLGDQLLRRDVHDGYAHMRIRERKAARRATPVCGRPRQPKLVFFSRGPAGLVLWHVSREPTQPVVTIWIWPLRCERSIRPGCHADLERRDRRARIWPGVNLE